MFVTLDVSNSLSDWLNELAPMNIPLIFTTLDVSNPFSGWLNDVAWANIQLMFTTFDVSQQWIVASKFVKPLNKLLMSLISDTSQMFGSPWFFTPRSYSTTHCFSSSFVCGCSLRRGK